MNFTTFLPILIPLISAVTLLFMEASRAKLRKAFTVLSLFIQFLFSIFLVYSCSQGAIHVSLAGGWAAPYGIALVIDLFSAIMLAATSLVFLTTTLYGFFESRAKSSHYLRWPLIFFLQTGSNLSLITGDFFNLFVAFEIMLSSSYALMTLEAKGDKIKQAFPYVTTNLLGSLIFLCSAAMVYGYTKNLNMAALAIFMRDQSANPLIIAIGLLLIGVFGMKAGMFPLYFWLPNSYPILPFSLAALFGGILTKIGIYLIIRLFVTIFPHHIVPIQWLLIILAGFTMVLGVLGAISRHTIRGILSYHIISQIGYMLFAIGVFTPLAITAAILFMIHNILVKSSLFLYGGIAGVIYETDDIYQMGSVWRFAPVVGLLFLVQALSLAGLPPFSGFWGKYLIILEGLRTDHYILAILAILTSALTLFSMIKIWTSVFWGTPKEVRNIHPSQIRKLTWASCTLAIFSVAMGLAFQYAFDLTHKATEEIFNKEVYIQAVYSVQSIK